MTHTALRTLCCIALLVPVSYARGKDKKPAEKDSFDVVGHLVFNTGAISNLTAATHYSSSFVYATDPAAGTVTVIEVTSPAHPRLVTVANRTGSPLAAAGDALLVTSEVPAPAPAQTVSILDFTDKASPKVVREFAGVTSIGTDNQRGLVFLVNAEGLWILHRNQQIDPAIQEQYAHDVIYNH
jgi:hypothetical protein